jgi:hypothetical protein
MGRRIGGDGSDSVRLFGKQLRNYIDRAATQGQGDQTMNVRRTLVQATVFCCAALLTVASGAAQETQLKTRYRDIRRVLFTGTEAQKMAIVEELVRLHEYDPLTAQLLSEVLPKLRLGGKLYPSTVGLIRLAEHHNEHEPTVKAMVGLLDPRFNDQYLMIVMDVVSRMRIPAATVPLIQLSEKPSFEASYGFRKSLIRAVLLTADDSSTVAVDFLMGHLPELGGELQLLAVRYLSFISQQEFGSNLEMWTTWWSDNRADFKFQQSPSGFSVLGGRSTEDLKFAGGPNLFGVGVRDRRMIFIVDQHAHPELPERSEQLLEAAKEEMVRTIEALGDDVYFSIIGNGRSPSLSWKGIRIADENNKKAAVRFVERMKLETTSDTFGCLKLALKSDDNLEAIYVVAVHGVPLPSELRFNDAAKQFHELNQFHRVGVYVAALGVTDSLSTIFLSDVATGSGGSLRRVERHFEPSK